MKQSLESQLYAIDPVFFRQKDLDMTQTCMCWGIECGDGWFAPIKRFVEQVAVLNKVVAPLNMCIVASQIKSKWADFTCYWNLDVLDESIQKEHSKSEQQLLETIYKLMDNAVSGCTEECSHTCELCGKESPFNDEVFACGSWLTVKCVECAQKEQRQNGRITSFREGFRFLTPFIQEYVTVNGVEYPTIIGAYYGTLHPQYEALFREMHNPAEVQSVAVEMGLCCDDDKAFKTMEEVLRIRYSNPAKKELLLSTKGLEIVQLNYSHENKWGSCNCKDCVENKRGENHYGKMLMKIRDEIEPNP